MLSDKINIIIIFIVLIGSFNWGATAFEYNLVDMLSTSIDDLTGRTLHIDKFIYLLVAFSGLLLGFKRDVWLPFLSKTVIPESIIPLKKPNTNLPLMTLQIKTKPNTKVVYWAAMNKDNSNLNVKQAYNNYENSGVIISDNNGFANLTFVSSNQYNLPSGIRLPRHIHYREFTDNNMLGPLKTVYY